MTAEFMMEQVSGMTRGVTDEHRLLSGEVGAAGGGQERLQGDVEDRGERAYPDLPVEEGLRRADGDTMNRPTVRANAVSSMPAAKAARTRSSGMRNAAAKALARTSVIRLFSRATEAKLERGEVPCAAQRLGEFRRIHVDMPGELRVRQAGAADDLRVPAPGPPLPRCSYPISDGGIAKIAISERVISTRAGWRGSSQRTATSAKVVGDGLGLVAVVRGQGPVVGRRYAAAEGGR